MYISLNFSSFVGYVNEPTTCIPQKIMLLKNTHTHEPSIKIMIIIYNMADRNIIYFINGRMQKNNNNNGWMWMQYRYVEY